MPKGFVTRDDKSVVTSTVGEMPASGEVTGTIQVHQKKHRTRKAGIAATLTMGLVLSGCASPVIGALTIIEIGSIAGLVSTFMSGRDLTEHALSAATGQDCRILESILRPDRKFCEDHGSDATAHDFRGVIALLGSGNNTILAQADIEVQRATDPVALGFAPINRQIAVENFSLEVVQSQVSPRTGHRVSFGMLQASYGQSWSYELTARRAGAQIASAEPTALSATRSDGAIIVPHPVTN